MTKQLQLSREALGNRRYKYTVGVTRRVDGTFELLVTAAGLQGAHKMPEPSPDKRPFVADDLDDLGVKTAAFLQEWRAAAPECGNQVLCCTTTVDNALSRARKKLAAIADGTDAVRTPYHGR